MYNYDDSTPDIPGDTPGDNTETQLTAYFNNANSNWTNVYAYAWDNSNNSEFLGSWPGTQISIEVNRAIIRQQQAFKQQLQ